LWYLRGSEGDIVKPLFVSFFTRGTGYEQQAEGLIESLVACGVEFKVEGAPNFGGWAANCQHKPVYLSRMMRLHPGRPLVWLDSDARVRQCPTLFDSLDCDFAATWKGKEMLAGTLYFAPSPAAAKLLEDWQNMNRWNPNGEYGDQGNLQKVIAASSDLRIGRLPASYTAIFDANMCPREAIVIEHLQASRKLKSRIPQMGDTS
jgi:hypothetical protein